MAETDSKRTRIRGRRRPGLYLRLASAMAVVATLVVAVVLADRFGTDPSLVSSPLIGQPAPEVSLPRLDRLDAQDSLSLTDLQGKVLVVNFWASWCVACRSEHDDLVATATAFQDRRVTFVGVVYQDRREGARGTGPSAVSRRSISGGWSPSGPRIWRHGPSGVSTERSVPP